MPASGEIDGAAGVPEFYGKELRWQRERAGLTLEQTVRGCFYSVSFLSEIERGRRRMPEDLAQHVDKVLETDGFFARCCADVRKARRHIHGRYFAEVLEMEARASDIVEWAPTLIPGPLQLEPYIEAVVYAAHPHVTQGVLNERIRTRRERAWVMEDAEGPVSWVVLHESIIQQPILGYGDMAEQLAHVAAVARRRQFVPQILPADAGAHPFMSESTWLMEFSGAPPVMYTESMYTGQVIEGPGTVQQCRNAYDRLRAAALPPELSLRLIESAAADYRNGKRPREFSSRLTV
ncbi:Scr1 family TA system antitoxin-like transcriptional regulator [Streptomyces sp. NPDC102278]|uniref:helix-turn-helix domain-containing protein n=1 Tax=Streptomyces sp. NPDC102278 TaxID=3366152 RepID=UPI0038239657